MKAKTNLIDFLEKEGIITSEESEKMRAKVKSSRRVVVLVRKDRKEYFSKFLTDEMMAIMEYLKETYEKNNEISSQMMSKIPGMLLLVIDIDVNKQKEHPIIAYYRLQDEQEETEEYNTIIVRKSHKIIWSILEQLYPKEITGGN